MQRSLQPVARRVHDPAALDEDAVEEPAVGLAVPSEMVVKRQRRMAHGRPELERGPSLELFPKAIDAPLGDEILEPGVPAVGAVAVVPEDRGHNSNCLDSMRGRHEAEWLSQACGGVAFVVGHAEPAADQEVEPPDSAVSHDRQQPHVLGVDVHAVVDREPDRGLELPRQVPVAVERLLLLGGHLLLALEPDLVIRLRRGAQLLRQGQGYFPYRRMVGVGQRRGAAHHVPLHVAAGGDGGEQIPVDAGDGGLQIALEHAMKLEALARGHPQSAVGMPVGDLLQGEVLLRGDRAGGNRHPHHEGVGLLRTGRLAPSPLVPRVLLVGPVKLEQLYVVVLEVSRAGGERLRDGSAEMAAVSFSGLDLRFGFHKV